MSKRLVRLRAEVGAVTKGKEDIPENVNGKPTKTCD